MSYAQRGSTQTMQVAAVTTGNVGKPAGVVAGDVLIIGVGIQSTQALTMPASFTKYADSQLVVTELNFGAVVTTWVKIADGTEGANFTISWPGADNVIAYCIAYSGITTYVIEPDGSEASKYQRTNPGPTTANLATSTNTPGATPLMLHYGAWGTGGNDHFTNDYDASITSRLAAPVSYSVLCLGGVGDELWNSASAFPARSDTIHNVKADGTAQGVTCDAYFVRLDPVLAQSVASGDSWGWA